MPKIAPGSVADDRHVKNVSPVPLDSLSVVFQPADTLSAVKMRIPGIKRNQVRQVYSLGLGLGLYLVSYCVDTVLLLYL